MTRFTTVSRQVGAAEQAHVTLVVVALSVAAARSSDRICERCKPPEVRDDRGVDVETLQLATRQRERNFFRTGCEYVVVERFRREDARDRLRERLRIRLEEVRIVIVVGTDDVCSIFGKSIAIAERNSSSVRPMRRMSESPALPISRKFFVWTLSHLSAAFALGAIRNKAQRHRATEKTRISREFIPKSYS